MWLQPEYSAHAAPASRCRAKSDELVSGAKSDEGVEVDVAPRPRERELAVGILRGVESNRTHCHGRLDPSHSGEESNVPRDYSLRSSAEVRSAYSASQKKLTGFADVVQSQVRQDFSRSGSVMVSAASGESPELGNHAVPHRRETRGRERALGAPAA